jgi:alkaline phosphatase
MALSVVLAMVLSAFALATPTRAQGEAPSVKIYPINRATFIPGAKFDFQVEVQAKELPADFKITVNGEDAAKFFAKEAKNEVWKIGSGDKAIDVTAPTMRQVTLPKAGEYKVDVVAGGKTTSVKWTAFAPQAGKAKNVILFIADGMSNATITAARLISKGQSDGKYNGKFVFDTFTSIGMVSTSSVDSIMADSANTASALNTGHKGSVNATGTYSNTSADILDDPRVETFAEMIRRTRGMAVGIVTTADFTDASPAAVWAHGRNRSDAARQFYATSALDEGLKPEVIFGGGSQRMIPKATAGSRRSDERNVIADYEKAGYKVVTNKTELMAAKDAKMVLGLFHSSDMNVWLDRNVYKDNVKNFPDQPGLADMTVSALDILKANPNGFFLEVESASVDKQMHGLDYERAIADQIEFERAVAAAVAWTEKNAPDTLIIVTADHAHAYDVWGTVDTKKMNEGKTDLEKRESVRLYNAAGFPSYKDADGDGFPDSWEVAITLAGGVADFPNHSEDYQVSKKPRAAAACKTDETTKKTVCLDNPEDDPNGIQLMGNLDPANNSGAHSLQDVPLYANGPGAAWFTRHMEQSDVFFGMVYAIGLDLTAKDGKVAAAIAPIQSMGANLPIDGTNVFLLVIGLVGGFVIARRKR